MQVHFEGGEPATILALMMTIMAPSTSASSVHAPLSIGFRAGSDTLVLRAVSTGCTRRDDFECALDEQKLLNVSRVRADRCRARPRTVRFEYTFEELGLTGEVNVAIADAGV